GAWRHTSSGQPRAANTRRDPMQELVLNQPVGTARGELVREAAQSDARREFEERLAECGPLAFRVARGVLRNTADAEDVAQEALLRAYESFERLRDRNRFRGWLVRISFRLALDRLRSAKRRKQRDTLWSQPANLAPAVTAEDIVASNQFQGHLERALEELPEKVRLVLLLSAIDGFTIEEISSMLGVPLGTVKSRIFIARKKLAEKLRCHANTIRTR
ncbi:MAG TPA: sigma-70 family RNA polymerase sigma factor, partial [Candidatus Dormibacteraeota bacterium]|nr:sigma-70 family RNA polymerase sigma factor [Candidatus Dormibacteraeota bacterium]